MKFLFTILFLFSITAFAGDYGDVKAEYVRTIDGDTIVVNISKWPSIIGRNIPVRVRGIDCPELNSNSSKERSKARDAKKLTQAELRKALNIKLKNIERGKYFRIVADVKYGLNKDLAEILLKNKLADRYTK